VPERAAQPGELRVLCLGRIHWKKGLDLAIRAVAAVPAARLRIVGNDEEGLRPELDRLANALGVSDRVDLSGPLYGEAKAAAYAAADVLLMPSLSENFGNSALEAMAAGLPVITTPEVGAAALVESAGAGLVVERSESALAAALGRLANDPALRQRMGRAGRDAAAMHSWDAKAAEMAQFYAAAAGGRVRDAA
jgi:glycosyltransferase involved in cell wall biosynthesis